jgi:cytochrome c peroxidase
MTTVPKLLSVAVLIVAFSTNAVAQRIDPGGPVGILQLTPKENLGKRLFFDNDLSTPQGMSCATCHAPSAGFADPRPRYPTSLGAVNNRFGARNAPSSAYAFGGPEKLALFNGGYAGGAFWDGRADTLTEQAAGPLLNPLEMNNPTKKHVVTKVQQADYAQLFKAVYGKGAFAKADAAFDYIGDAISAYERSDEMNPRTSKFDLVMAGKAAFTPTERMGMMLFNGRAGCTQCHFSGPVMNRACPDGCACGCAYTGVCTCATCICDCAHKGSTACEGGCTCGCAETGVCLCSTCSCGCLNSDANACAGGCTCGCAFTGVCKCATCDCGCPTTPLACAGGCTCGCAWTGICNCGPGCNCGCASGGMIDGKPLFTNHGYFNLGIPKNSRNPFYDLPKKFNPQGDDYVDLGLGATIDAMGIAGAEQEMGKFKVPSLRNCAKTAPYAHNGFFPDLQSVIRFYNTRDVPNAGWAPPEVAQNVFMGNIKWGASQFGNLALTDDEIDALVAFLETLTD